MKFGKPKIGLCIPVLNAGDFAIEMVAALGRQSLVVDRFLLFDSGCTDGSIRHFFLLGPELYEVEKKTFDHGGTRQLAVDLLGDCDIVMFLTQDAIPADPDCFEKLVSCFDNEDVGAAFGRQLPRRGASPIEAHARLFNYPGESRVKSAEDIPTLGLKTVFISNSCAAYRLEALRAVGGFPKKTIIGEDTYVAGKMILAGWKIAYHADARVFHSHPYSLLQEWQRYFDTGVFHARNDWMRESFGGAEGEGMRFLKSEVLYLADERPGLIPSALLRMLFRYLGFRLGLLERYLPLGCKRWMSAQKSFWGRES